MKKINLLLFPMLAFGLNFCGKTAGKKLSTDELFQKVKDAIVYIGVRDEQGRFVSQGTGIIVTRDGYILSNWHVLSENAGGMIQLQNGANYFYEKALELDPYYDLGLVKIEGKTDFQKAEFADSDNVKIGQKVVAIGNPRGMTHTVSEGIISALRGGITDKQIQFTAPISPGSSGGAIFDEYGRVIGITTMTLLESQNINFAVPINFARSLIYRRTIPAVLSLVKMDKEDIGKLETYVPFEAALITALLNETIDQSSEIKTDAVSLDTLQASNYDAYLQTAAKVDNDIAKMFSYLEREEAFLKALNFLKTKNEKLVEKYKDAVSGAVDTTKILELKEYFTSGYYYQMLQCNVSMDDKTIPFLAVEDYGRDKNKCLSHTQTYLDHGGGTDRHLKCTTGDEKTAASSCIKKEHIYPTIEPYFSNKPAEHYYASGLYPVTKQPIRYIFLKDDPLTRGFCKVVAKQESVMMAAGGKCIAPKSQ